MAPICPLSLTNETAQIGTVISLFRHITWPTSVFVHNKLSKTATMTYRKLLYQGFLLPLPLPLPLPLLLVLHQTAYLKPAYLSFGIKRILSLLCMILDHQSFPRILLKQQESTSSLPCSWTAFPQCWFFTHVLLRLHQCDRCSPEAQELSEAQKLSEEESWISTDINTEHTNLLAFSKFPSKNCYIIHTGCSGKGVGL